MNYSDSDLSSFLDIVSFTVLTLAAREALEADITLEEVQAAVGGLKGGKTPGGMAYHPNFTPPLQNSYPLN